MATRPTETPEWDINDTNSVKPAQAQIDDGFSSGDRPPASWFNWLHQNIGQWIEHMAEAVINNFTVDTGIDDGGSFSAPRMALVAYNPTAKHMVVVNSDGDGLFFNNGGSWQNASFAFNDTISGPVAFNGDGELIIPDGSTGISRTSFSAGAYAAVTSIGGSSDPLFAGYDAANTQCLVVYGGGAEIATVQDGTFTRATVRASDSDTKLLRGTVSSASGVSIAYGYDDTGAQLPILFSSNATGTTWTSRTPAGTDAFFCGAFDPVLGAYVVAGESGVIERSTDGTTWTDVANTVTADFRSLTILKGGTYVAVYNTATEVGVAISSDSGSTWVLRPLHVISAGPVGPRGDGVLDAVQTGIATDEGWLVLGLLNTTAADDTVVANGFKFSLET